MNCKPLPCIEFLRECFSYKKASGTLTWNVRPLSHFRSERSMNIWNARYAKKSSMYADHRGYVYVRINRSLFLAHRVVWALVTGNDPGVMEIDHRNRNPNDMRWMNLRMATSSQNGCNTRTYSNNTTGVKGVSWNREHKKYEAYADFNGKRIKAGYFKTIKEARTARKILALSMHGAFHN